MKDHHTNPQHYEHHQHPPVINTQHYEHHPIIDDHNHPPGVKFHQYPHHEDHFRHDLNKHNAHEHGTYDHDAHGIFHHQHNAPSDPHNHYNDHEPLIHEPINVDDPQISHILQAGKHISSHDPHENHHQIQTILEKLRDENPDHVAKRRYRRSLARNVRSFFSKLMMKEEEKEEHHPKVLSNDDRWLAGCLLQCVFRKNNAVDKHGYPTLDGLTDLYTAGTTEQEFFVHVLRSADKCLKSVSTKHKIYRGKVPAKGETCDVAFDVFDCVSDAIIEYCKP